MKCSHKHPENIIGKKRFQPGLLATAITLTLSPLLLQAEETTLDEMVIIGTSENAKHLAGSGAIVDNEQMEIEVASDINQLLKTVPGVYVLEEEGNGLRPNIGIRGATSERSEKITLLEDGVMIAPAPYSNPAAYYFPTILRMSSIEVLKGAPLLRYGPQTTGGVVNMLSTPIPQKYSGEVSFSTGSFNSSDLHAYYGGREDQWGWLLEAVERNSGGFKEIDRSNRNSGYNISDYVAKLRWEADKPYKESALLKLQHSEEISNSTYVGLTDDDFDADPTRRYGLSSIDQMENDHTGVQFVYSRELTDSVTANTTLYYNEFNRNWFKLSGGGSLIDDANNGDATAQGILDGDIDTTGLNYKNNNRAYESSGIEVNFDVDIGLHRLAIGARLHEDEMDRFQPVEVYDQVSGSLVPQSVTAPTGSDNRIEKADAATLWITDDWQVDEKLNVNLSLRYEDIESSRVQYDDEVRNTVDSTRSNQSSELLPGASFTYTINDSWQILGGVHNGFSPLGGGATEDEEPETSVNWEFGGRYNNENLFVEAIAFYSDFSDKTENCSLGSPCSDGATSGTFVNGEAVISGLETQLGTEWQGDSFNVPLSIAYTYTQTEISGDNPTNGLLDGDQLKDIPESAFSARVGLEHSSGWNNYAIVKYVDEMCVAVGCNRSSSPQAETDALFVVDYISRYRLNKTAEVYFKAENLFDEQKIVARSPDGARPNKPQSVMLGMKVGY